MGGVTVRRWGMADTAADPAVAPDELTDAQRELIGGGGAPAAEHLPRPSRATRACSGKWLPFGGKLLAGGKLTARDRRARHLALRVPLRGPRYEWAQHVAIAGTAGLTDEEIRARRKRARRPGLERRTTPRLLRAVDELHDDHCIGDATWSALAERYTTEQLIEIPMLSGHYAMLAGVLNSLGVQPETPDLPALGEA